MFDGVNALRQHTTPDSRIHGIIVDGGTAPNITPAFARSKWFVRAADRKYLNGLTQKVVNCAKGAAMMTGATMEWKYFENSYDNMKLNPTLISLFADCMHSAGVENVNTEVQPPSGSSDVGNVAWVCPTVMANMGVGNTDNSGCHEEAFLSYCTGPYGFAALHKAILAQVFLALNVFTDTQLQQKLAEDKAVLTKERAEK